MIDKKEILKDGKKKREKVNDGRQLVATVTEHVSGIFNDKGKYDSVDKKEEYDNKKEI